MTAARKSLLFALASATLACSSSVDGGDPSGAGGAGGAGTGGSGFEPGGEMTTYEAVMGPITVQAGAEKTQCIAVRLDNAEGAFVRRFRAELSQGSHHMIVYRSQASSEVPTPSNCVGFSGLLQGDHPIFIAQQPTSELALPTDEGKPVGIEILPEQMLRIEVHYVNPTAAPIEVTGEVLLDTVPLSADVIKSDFGFWGTTKFQIQPNSSYSTGVLFQPGLPNTKSFALTTHQHHLGTRMRVWHAEDAAVTGKEPAAESTTWADPPLEIFSPPLEFPGGAGSQSPMGYAFQCEWSNTTPYTVSFGEGFNDEMCFLWHYYYPSKGFHYCSDGWCKVLP
jgi:hypothetical protein